MPRVEFESALTAAGWSQAEMDELRAMILEIIGLGQIHLQAKANFAAAISRWNGGVSAKVAGLGAAFAIPNPTDLAGTSDLVKENLSGNLMAYVSTIQGLGTQSHLDNLLPLVGSVNL